jgi:hypothetical protein
LREDLAADSPVMLRAAPWLDELHITGRLSPPRFPAEALFG